MKQKKLYITGICIIFQIMSLLLAGGQFAGGEGSAEAPYLVESAQQLNNVRNHMEASFKQVADIDLAELEKDWEPIGEYHMFAHPLNEPFKGSYDGDGYKITNLSADIPEKDYIGLFGYIGEGAHIQNVHLEGADVAGYRRVGALVGHNEKGVISACFAEADVYGYWHIGGLIGRNRGEVENSHSDGSVEGYNSVGGLCGENNGVVKNSFTVSEVSGERNTGGLIGRNDGEVIKSYYDMETTDQEDEGKGEPRSTDEMMQEATFVDWDFEEIWSIEEGQSYPFLQ